MMGYSGFFPFGALFMILYVGVVVYALIQLNGISKALRRIADALERKRE